jgi:hypothetical protein
VQKRCRWPAALPITSVVFTLAASQPAWADWSIGAQASARHDNNVGNAQYSDDIVADTIIAARLSAFRMLPLADNYVLSAGGDLSGEHYNRLDGLNNASLDAVLALKKKWGLGAYAPWARGGVSVGKSNFDDHYRNVWIYRATLSAGRRLNERWNFWADYSFDRRSAPEHLEQEVPGLSSDTFSQNAHNLTFTTEFAVSSRVSISLALQGRHGDVVSTSHGDAQIYHSSRALAEDPSFGEDFYAYKLTGTTYAVRAGLNYSATEHSLLGLGFRRVETHADGGNNYTKSIPEITWDYRF